MIQIAEYGAVRICRIVTLARARELTILACRNLLPGGPSRFAITSAVSREKPAAQRTFSVRDLIR